MSCWNLGSKVKISRLWNPDEFTIYKAGWVVITITPMDTFTKNHPNPNFLTQPSRHPSLSALIQKKNWASTARSFSSFNLRISATNSSRWDASSFSCKGGSGTGLGNVIRRWRGSATHRHKRHRQDRCFFLASRENVELSFKWISCFWRCFCCWVVDGLEAGLCRDTEINNNFSSWNCA